MFQKLSKWIAGHKLFNERLRVYLVTGALLTLSIVAQGQITSSGPCSRGFYNQRAYCGVWAQTWTGNTATPLRDR